MEVLDAGPISNALPDLARIAGNDGNRVVTISNHGPIAEQLGVRNSFGSALKYSVLGDFAKLAAEGRFTLPISRTFRLDEWRTVAEISLNGRAKGKLMLLPTDAVALSTTED